MHINKMLAINLLKVMEKMIPLDVLRIQAINYRILIFAIFRLLNVVIVVYLSSKDMAIFDEKCPKKTIMCLNVPRGVLIKRSVLKAQIRCHNL